MASRAFASIPLLVYLGTPVGGISLRGFLVAFTVYYRVDFYRECDTVIINCRVAGDDTYYNRRTVIFNGTYPTAGEKECPILRAIYESS